MLATLRIGYPDARAEGGFVLLHPATGDTYTDDRRHLVATCRAVSNFALGTVVDGPEWCLDATAHGVRFLEEAHRAEGGKGYHLIVDAEGDPLDRTRSAYAHAFVLLAYARAADAGIKKAARRLDAVTELLEDRFVERDGLLRSDCTPDWSELEPYRGQNANMHACEAYLAAYETTGDDRYLERAGTIARRLTVELATETDGLLWEHYTLDWDHDFTYNEDEPNHQFRPPGYQPGHHVEWAKLLSLLDRHGVTPPPGDGWYRRAVDLFDAAIELGWTGDGFVYTATADGETIVADQYGWALAEGIGAAAALAERADARGAPDDTERFFGWHGKLVERAERFRGPAGLWYEKRSGADDAPIGPDPPGVEPDYHPLSAWYESWRSVRLQDS